MTKHNTTKEIKIGDHVEVINTNTGEVINRGEVTHKYYNAFTLTVGKRIHTLGLPQHPLHLVKTN